MAMKLSVVLFVFGLVVAVMAAAPVAEAKLGALKGLLGLISIRGTLFCTADGNISADGSSTPVFPSATVQLLCGNDTIVSTSTTNGQGAFTIRLNPLQVIVSTLVSNCNLVVNTPLSSCNVTLPSVGRLVSPLQFIGDTILGFLDIANLAPSGFALG